MYELKKIGARLGMLGAFAMTEAGCNSEKPNPEKIAKDKYAWALENELDALHLDEEEKTKEVIPASVIELADAEWKQKATQALLENGKWNGTSSAYEVLGEILEALSAHDVKVLLEQQPNVSTGIPELLRNMFIDANDRVSDLHRYVDRRTKVTGGGVYFVREGESLTERIKKIRATQEKIALVLKELEQSK